MLIDKIQLNKPLPQDELKEYQQKWDFWGISYDADVNYLDGSDDAGNDILQKFDCELPSDFKSRKKNTPIKGFVKPIIEKYNASVFRNAPVRTDIPDYLYENADGLGSNYDTMMQRALKIAQIYGKSYLMPLRSDVGEVLTIAQAQASNARTFVRVLDPYAVVDTTEVDEVLLEAIVLLTNETGDIFARYMNNSIFIDLTLEKGKVVGISSEYPHGYSAIPLVQVDPEISAESQAAPIANSQKFITNLYSLLNQEIKEQTFTRYCISGIRTEDNNNEIQAQWSSKRLLVVEDSNVTVTRLSADTSQSDSIRASIKEELEGMYRNAGLSAASVDMTNQVASGISLIVNREDFNLICSKLKYAIEVADNRLMSLIAEIEGFTYVPSKYSDIYMAADESEAIAKVRDILALAVPSVLKNAMIMKYAETFFNLSEEDMRKLEEEINNVG